jgi:riboflavin kinase
VEGVMQISQGYVETIKLFIAAVLTGYGLSIPLKDLLDLVKMCPAQSANRPLMKEEEDLRATWVTMVYLIAQHVQYRNGVVKDAHLLIDSNLLNDDSEVWTVYKSVLPRLQELHGEGNETGPRFNAEKVIEGNSDLLSTLLDDSYQKALVLQNLRVMWITLTVLEEEKLCLDQKPPVPPIPNQLGLSNSTGPLIPSSPEEQQRWAIRSIRNAIKDDGVAKPPRLYVDFLIPLPPETKAEDIDPWPGGLAQMYPYAESILQQILSGIVDKPAGPASSQVISNEDCCGFFVQESLTSPKNDVAAILFPGVDQLDKIEEIEEMVGSRTLILFNRQFKLPVDFGFADERRAKKLIFDKFGWGFAFQELACRGEDVKLTFEYPYWNSCVVCSEDVDAGVQEIALLDPQPERPTYEALEKRINEVLPEPLWMRKMGEAERKGIKFQRDIPKPSSTDKKPLSVVIKDEKEASVSSSLSSSSPRYKLLENRLLFRGPVDQGYGRGGKQLGFPTANLPSTLFQNALEDVQNGVYFGWAVIEGRNNNKAYKAIVNVGLSPTFEGAENPEKIIEAHLRIPDDQEPFSDFYGETMRLQLDAFMRPERKFPSFPELMAQITADVQDASAALDKEPFVRFQKTDFLTLVSDDKSPWTGSGGGDANASWEKMHR